MDRLSQLLEEHERLYGIVCRDVTAVDIEVMAQEGCHLVFFDLEHSSQAASEVMVLGRIACHVGMVPMARIPELRRTHVQVLLDGGMQVIVLPDVRTADEARELVRLGKYPPQGARGVSSTTAGAGYAPGADAAQTLREGNEATHLMVMIESDEGYEALDEILAVEGFDLISVGKNDWATSLGLFGAEATAALSEKIDRVVGDSSRAGKTVAANVSSRDQADHFFELGARIFYLGTDISIKRKGLADTMGDIRG